MPISFKKPILVLSLSRCNHLEILNGISIYNRKRNYHLNSNCEYFVRYIKYEMYEHTYNAFCQNSQLPRHQIHFQKTKHCINFLNYTAEPKNVKYTLIDIIYGHFETRLKRNVMYGVWYCLKRLSACSVQEHNPVTVKKLKS